VCDFAICFKWPAPRSNAWAYGRHVLKILAFCFVCTMPQAATLRSSAPQLNRSRSFSASVPPSCYVQCVVSRGVISCPHFLDTPEHYPCVDYKMELTACGWQLQRVFMCH
jgi:hypothetical protein